jgi:hypothetical protein
MRQDIFSEVSAERDVQDAKWGHKFDDRNTPYNWAAYIAQYATRNLIGDPYAVSDAKFRVDMVKVAALAVAAIESIDRSNAS